MAATLKVPTIFTAVDKMSSVVKTMTRNVRGFTKRAGDSVLRFNQKLNRSFSKMNRLAQLGLGLGAFALFQQAIQGNIQFNDSLASVSAITGAVGEDLANLERLAMASARAQKKSGAEILKAYELVGSAKPELLQNAEALDAVTNSVITLSKASRLDLEQSSLSLTAVMNQFNKTAAESNKVVDVMAAGAKYGAAQIPEISEAILQFGTGAKAANVSLEESVALIETFSLKGLKGAEAGTKLRNIISKMSAAKGLPKEAITQLQKYGVNLDVIADKTLPFNERLKELSKIGDDATAMVKVFGLQNKEAGQILLENIGVFEEMTKNVGENGVAMQQAEANTNTLKFAIESIKTSFINATTATNSNSKALGIVKKALFFVSENMETLVTIAASLVAGFVALKIITGIIKAIQFATYAWTAAQWLLNVALTANPIGIIIMAIVALVALVAVAIHKYDDWGASMLMLMGPFGALINIIQSLRRNWDMVVETFKTEGILAGLKKLSYVIIDGLLMPLEQFLGKLSNMGGWLGKFFKKAEVVTAFTRDGMGVDTGGKNALERVENIEQIGWGDKQRERYKNMLEVNIKDKGGNVESVKSEGDMDIPVTTTSTQGAF